MIAMGSNRFNKLNLNTRMGFFSHLKRPQQEVENIVEPKVVKAFQSRIVDVSLSSYHSGVLLENGHVHVFGRNKYGELGLGHRQTQVDAWLAAYRPVKALCAKTCVQLVCGNGFTMVATGDNELYFWGTRGIKKKTNETVTIEDLEIERSSSPAPELQATETPTWVQNELNEAEVLSYSHFMSGKKNGSKAKNNKEKQLRAEIEKLKQQVHQQSKTFKGHESQMALLQKLAELQALHTGHVNEPPPAYPQSAKGRSSSNKPRIIRNPFTPEAIPSKACNIL
uniref:Uncharacterized protein n=1 Tax=Panagrolaimus sp. JU765 TaxID=591449 RepID=A0AC34R2R0_9BILA